MALIVATYTKSSYTAAYHLKMVQYTLNLTTITTLMAVAYTIRRMRYPWYRVISLLLLLVVWIVPQAKGSWRTGDHILCELRKMGLPVDESAKDWNSRGFEFISVILGIIFVAAVAGLVHYFYNQRQKTEVPTSFSERPEGFCARLGYYALMFWPVVFCICGMVYIGKTIAWMRYLRDKFNSVTEEVENEWGHG